MPVQGLHPLRGDTSVGAKPSFLRASWAAQLHFKQSYKHLKQNRRPPHRHGVSQASTGVLVECSHKKRRRKIAASAGAVLKTSSPLSSKDEGYEV